jgi:hypothetical protein
MPLMTVAEALETIRQFGEIHATGETVHLTIPLAKAREMEPVVSFLRQSKREVLGALNQQRAPETCPIRGTSVELWCDAAGGRVWIVADEEDARLAAERFEVSLGEVWTGEEIEIVARFQDRRMAQEVADFKRRFYCAIKTEKSDRRE